MKLFNSDYVYAKIQKQIKDYVTNYNYTYSGIHKALVYYYEVKGNVFDEGKAQGGIGIEKMPVISLPVITGVQ